MNHKKYAPRGTKGFSFIELIVVLSIMSMLSLITLDKSKQEFDSLEARAIGMELYHYNAGVGKYLASEFSALSATTHSDAHWLRSTECYQGEARHHYLPCHFFPDGTSARGNLSVTTTLSTLPSGEVSARTVVSPILDGKGRASATMMAIAATVASSGSSYLTGPGGGLGGIVYYCPDLPTYPEEMARICREDRNRLVMLVSASEGAGVSLGEIMRTMVK